MFIIDPNFVAGPYGDYFDFCGDGTNPNENFSFVCADENNVVNETEQFVKGSDEGLDHLRTNTDRDGTNPKRSIEPNNENYDFVNDDENIVVNETEQLDKGSDEGLVHLRTNTDRDETNDEEINGDETDKLNDGSIALTPNESDNQVANPNKRAHELQVELDLANAEMERLKKEVATYQQHSKNTNGSEIQLQCNKDLYTENHELETQNTDLVSRIAQLEEEITLQITDAYLSNADNDDRFTKAQEQLREANEKIAKSDVELSNLHEQLNILKSKLKSTSGSF